MLRMTLSASPRAMRYRYFWLKYVTGFDASACCQRSLLGRVSKRVTLDSVPWVTTVLDESRAHFLYLCASLGDYATNLHVAMVPEESSAFRVMASSGLVVEVMGARKLEIPEVPVELAATFTDRQVRCRNFRFGASVYPSALRAAS